ncbi:MAG: shikimate kinase [Bdellovibrio sp.]|jgi:shikimate kinase
MQIFLIGHRGTGKTSLLQRMQIYGRGSLPVFDLDREIERSTGKAIAEIFADQGEASFRDIEKKTLAQLIRTQSKMIVALGAGFELGSFVFPADCEIVWVRRSSDAWGRIFADRPRLNNEVSALIEYRERYRPRETLYSRNCDWIYWLPEGLTSPCEFEKAIWNAKLDGIGGILTLRPDHFRNPKIFRTRLRHAGTDYFELRSDFLSEGELAMADEWIANERKLVAIRTWPLSEEWKQVAEKAGEVDWALELGAPQALRVTCVSSHEQPDGTTMASWTKDFEAHERKGLHIKWSPLVETFEDLEFGLQWQNQKPEQRSFLPRSTEGRWAWVRLLLKGRQKLNFWRDGDGSSVDQPILHEWIRCFPQTQTFAAVLGHPVNHSYSPIEHLEFSRDRRVGFFAIDIAEDEWPLALPLLRSWGLKFAAVTSPLKKKAFTACEVRSELADQLSSVNTLTLAGSQWRGTNTDLAGLQALFEGLELGTSKTLVWGGGGTLGPLQLILPSSTAFYSLRTQGPREGSPTLSNPEIVIWAAGPGDAPPPTSLGAPGLVVDLNYREDSFAREYAMSVNARYISGLVMFKAQAAEQRQEWEKYVE